MFDTHCHLNFKDFIKNVRDVVERAREASVDYFIIPGTDLDSSRRAIEIAEQYEGVYLAIGIHPHPAFDFNSKFFIKKLEELIVHPKVVAVGEIGLDKHIYKKTKYKDYQVDSEFVELQKELLVNQIKLAVKYKKTVILHNREAVEEILELLSNKADLGLSTNMVFHCCEPDDRLLKFAIKHCIFIGVDGDVTYDRNKQEFVKKIPLDLLVLETDSPYLLPEPLRTQKLFPNEPKNIKLIAEFIAKLKGETVETIADCSIKNAKKLFFK
jgi:TatD DNase family protein